MVRLAGLDQYVRVHGARARDPLLLVLHGGPGFVEGPLFAAHNGELERHFLVAHWDQRGAGRSYVPEIPAESMTLRQFVDDAVELIDWLRRRFDQETICLLGHSWGTLIGATVAHKHPAKLHAYVGVGQFVNGRRNMQLAFASVLDHAREADRNDAADALRAIEPRFTNGNAPSQHDLLELFRWLGEFGLETHTSVDLFAPIEPEERAVCYGERNEMSTRFSLRHLLSDLLAADLPRTAPRFEIPVHFVIGRHDRNTPAELAADYFDLVQAPDKQLHWFDHSAHMVPFEEPAKFNALMIDRVRPTRPT